MTIFETAQLLFMLTRMKPVLVGLWRIPGGAPSRAPEVPWASRSGSRFDYDDFFHGNVGYYK